MSAKKKVTQDELRRLMGEHKKKFTVGTKKIESPLAKYDALGQLTCIVCESIVRSEAVWAVHLNSKTHRENIARRAKRKSSAESEPEIPEKKPAFVKPLPPAPSRPIKSILKNSLSNKVTPPVPSDFFDSQSSIPPDKTSEHVPIVINQEISEGTEENNSVQEDASNDQLPEGFFDDPKLDAKVRNVEYKDPVEEEWELFQKEIKEETSKAQVIISEDQDEATTERQIDEIDEQLRHWSRVVSLEKKKQEAVPTATVVKNEKDDDDEDVTDFEEFVDWRSKSSFL